MRRALLGFVLMLLTAVGSAWLLDASIDKSDDRSIAPTDGRAALTGVRSWGYQLQDLQVERVAAAPHDLIVVDETLDGRRQESRAHVLTQLKRKPDGGRRLVLSYLSIGEAEDYRPYWRTAWSAPATKIALPARLIDLTAAGPTPARAHIRLASGQTERPLFAPTAGAPAWLGTENAEWRGNYNVRFWHPDWQGLIYGQPSAALDRIITAGFDGVYLDRADVYGLWRHERPSAKADMVDLVAEIADYARRKKPGFLVVLQNAEELLATRRLRQTLDGVAKEDLLFGLSQEGRANPDDEIQSSLHYLRQAKTEGLPVLVVEYLADLSAINNARGRIESEGFVAYFAPRALNMLAPGG
ncbi:MAG: endo alpha-1,4 polygalactosaminidase [Hyphomicrobiaceae bacterium]